MILPKDFLKINKKIFLCLIYVFLCQTTNPYIMNIEYEEAVINF